MKVWLTVEPNPEEVARLLEPKELGELKTPIEDLIDRAYGLMIMDNQVSLKITNMKRDYE